MRLWGGALWGKETKRVQTALQKIIDIIYANNIEKSKQNKYNKEKIKDSLKTQVDISEKFFRYFLKKDLIILRVCNILLPQSIMSIDELFASGRRGGTYG